MKADAQPGFGQRMRGVPLLGWWLRRREAHRQAVRQRRRDPLHRKRLVKEYAESLAIAFILAMFIRTFSVELFKIPSKSMEPTLMGAAVGGDRILVNKFIYDLNTPERWDVIVFKFPGEMSPGGGPLSPPGERRFLPGEKGRNYIKRLVGKPGEGVWVCQGDLYIRPPNGDRFHIARKPWWVQQSLWLPVSTPRKIMGEKLFDFVRTKRDRLLGPEWGRLAGFEEAVARSRGPGLAERVRRWRTRLLPYLSREAAARPLENGVRLENLVSSWYATLRQRLSDRKIEFTGPDPVQLEPLFGAWAGRLLGAARLVADEIGPRADRLLEQPEALFAAGFRENWRLPADGGQLDGLKLRLAARNGGRPAPVMVSYRHEIYAQRFDLKVDGRPVPVNEKMGPGQYMRQALNGPPNVGLAQDAKLEFDFRPESDGVEILCTAHRDGTSLVLVLKTGVGPTVKLYLDGRAVLEGRSRAPVVEKVLSDLPLSPGKQVHLAWTNVDSAAMLYLNGKRVLQHVFKPPQPGEWADASEASIEEAGPVAGIAFGCRAGTVVFENVCLYRDIYYTNIGDHAVRTPFQLDQDEFFCLGDNSPSSRDSRMWGSLPRQNIMGEAFIVIWPPGRIQIIRGGSE